MISQLFVILYFYKKIKGLIIKNIIEPYHNFLFNKQAVVSN